MKNRSRYRVVVLFILAMLISGCATLGDGDKTWKGGLIGTLGGAAAGAAIGATQGDAGKGAIIGAAAGAAVGTTTGIVLDAQEERFRKAGIRAERDAEGRLLVNLAEDHRRFESGKAELSPQGQDQINRIAQVFRAYPENRILIVGHTDSVGSKSFNLQLSQARAERVKLHLLKQGVTPESIVSAMGNGEAYPIADNATTSGRAANRRVEFRISVDEVEAARNQEQRETYTRH